MIRAKVINEWKFQSNVQINQKLNQNDIFVKNNYIRTRNGHNVFIFILLQVGKVNRWQYFFDRRSLPLLICKCYDSSIMKHFNFTSVGYVISL